MKPINVWIVCCLLGLVLIVITALPPVLKDACASERESDREQIVEIVNGIGNSADRRDWVACRAFWIEEPFVDYSSLSGQPGVRVRAADLIAGWNAFLPKFKFTQHFITNHEVRISGDRADCRSYVHAIHNLPFAEGGDMWGVYGVYEHELVKTPTGWKVSKMIFRLLAQEGNRGLPALAAKAPAERKVRFTSDGENLVGVLYTPAGHPEMEKLPAIIVTGSWTTVKEQMAGTYAKKLAAEGLIALAFDFRGFGESGGEPRQYESPQQKIQDIKNAVGFLQTLPMVNPEKIGGLGICASSGYMAEAVAEDKRMKVFAAIAPWFHDAELVKLIYGGEEGVKEKVAAGRAAKVKFEKTKVNEWVPACSTIDKQAAMFGKFEYYLNPQRGAIPEWKNQFAVMSWPDWLQFEPTKKADSISVPVLLIHSENGAIPDGAKRFYGKLVGKKDFYWMQGTQFDFYDNPSVVNEASKKAVTWLKENLN